jgi:hypothetical protein
MKKLIFILVIGLSSCQKNCYKFIITTTTTSWGGSSNPTTTRVTQCGLTAREAKKANALLNSSSSTGVGKQLVTVKTTSTYSIEP